MHSGVQFEDGKVCEAIVLVATYLVVQVVFEDSYVLWVVSV